VNDLLLGALSKEDRRGATGWGLTWPRGPSQRPRGTWGRGRRSGVEEGPQGRRGGR